MTDSRKGGTNQWPSQVRQRPGPPPPSNPAPKIEREPTEALAKVFCDAIKDHRSPMRTFEVLNALAAAAGITLAGVNEVDRERIRAWFDRAVTGQTSEMLDNRRNRP